MTNETKCPFSGAALKPTVERGQPERAMTSTEAFKTLDLKAVVKTCMP